MNYKSVTIVIALYINGIAKKKKKEVWIVEDFPTTSFPD